ncbi:type 2 periplasmic-binding domain-containing protein [Corallincola holothuriorum]|nr:amino acid ABC transporter substrate-binding protein [Corallincola holothuriorum]
MKRMDKWFGLFLAAWVMVALQPCQANERMGDSPSTATVSAAETIVRMTPKQSAEDASHSYLVALLALALDNTEPEYGPARVEFMPIALNQGLILHLLDIGGVLDVVASAPTAERETLFRAARVPLLMGLLGYRMMIIRPEDKEKFAAITEPEQLQALKACQGKYWPDTDILENQGYQVVRVEEFTQMFEYLQSGLCDYFPRAITEGYGELDAYNEAHPDTPLMAYDQTLLHYVVPFYFFTSHQNFELAARLELGLQRAIEQGALLELMKKHEVTKVAFPLHKWKDAVVFEVANPTLSKSIPLYEREYWLQLPVKQRKQ